MPEVVVADPTKITAEAWSKHGVYRKDQEHLQSGRRYVEELLRDTLQFAGLEFRSRIRSESQPYEPYTEIVLTPTVDEVVAVLCGDENMARTFNTTGIGVEDSPIVAFHVGSYDPGEGKPEVQTLSTLIISPSNPSREKIGFACDNSRVQPITRRADDRWFEVSVPADQWSWRALEIASFNLGLEDNNHDNRVPTAIMSSAYRWAGRLLEARRIKAVPQPAV